MKRNFIIVFCLVIFITIALLSLFCNNISPKDIPRSVSWVKIITGLTDSTNWPDDIGVSWKTFAKNLNKAGFRVSWNHVEDAEYYEIRISKNQITNKNWEKAYLVATVQNKTDSIITVKIDRIQPSISGRHCTGCKQCVENCPRHAITIFKGIAVIDPDSCIGCGMCYKVCTYNAVSDLNETNFYHFAVRPFTDDNVPAEDVICTNYAYKSRYVNKNYHNQSIGLLWCGFCGAGCYVINPKAGDSVDVGACPVNAVYHDPIPDSKGNVNSIHIDQSKCISCGLCIEQCGYNHGNWSVRREIISSEKLTFK